MQHKRKTLKNGVNVFTVQIPDAQSVVFSVMVKVGSRHESDDVAGVAHFLEHVFFKGSQNFPGAGEAQQLIDEIGGDFNAATSKETTEFYIKAEKNNLDLIFQVLTDMIQNPLFSESEIGKEKGVVIEELNMYQDSPGWQVFCNLDMLMWDGTPLAHDILGTKESVLALNREKIFKFKERYYIPANIILGVGGAFDERRVLQLIEEHWGALEKVRPAPAQRAADGQKAPRISIEYKKTQQAHLAVGFKSFGHRDKRNAAVFLLSCILGGSTSSRLWLNLREQKGLAYNVTASNNAYVDTGHFNVSAGFKADKALEALTEILSEIRKIKSDLVSVTELNRAKNYLKGKVALALEDNQEKLDWVVERFAFLGKVSSPEEFFKRIEAVTAEEVRSAANEVLLNERMNLAVIGPFKNRKDFQKEFYLKENY